MKGEKVMDKSKALFIHKRSILHIYINELDTNTYMYSSKIKR